MSERVEHNRAEQAAFTHNKVHEVAATRRGWEAPSVDDLPTANADSGLAEGTPLASKQSLTPGQTRRVEYLRNSEASFRPAGRLGLREGHTEHEKILMAAITRQVVNSMPSIREGEYEQADGSMMPVSLTGGQAISLESDNTDSNRDFVEEMRINRQLQIDEALLDAASLYDRKPDVYSTMPVAEFLELLSSYQSDAVLITGLYALLDALDEVVEGELSLGNSNIRANPEVDAVFVESEKEILGKLKAIIEQKEQEATILLDAFEAKYGKPAESSLD